MDIIIMHLVIDVLYVHTSPKCFPKFQQKNQAFLLASQMHILIISTLQKIQNSNQ